MFNSETLDVMTSKAFNSEAVAVTVSKMFNSSGVDVICVVEATARTGNVFKKRLVKILFYLNY